MFPGIRIVRPLVDDFDVDFLLVSSERFESGCQSEKYSPPSIPYESHSLGTIPLSVSESRIPDCDLVKVRLW